MCNITTHQLARERREIMLSVEERKDTRIQVLINEVQKEYLQNTAQEQGLSVSALIRQLDEEKMRENEDRKLRAAALALAEIYATDDELTAFTALDGEDFYE